MSDLSDWSDWSDLSDWSKNQNDLEIKKPLGTSKRRSHLFTFSLFHPYIYPNARSTSLRLAITINIIRMEMPAYSARTMNFSLGLRLVIIS